MASDWKDEPKAAPKAETKVAEPEVEVVPVPDPVPLYNPNVGALGRSPGVYLDEEELEQGEVRRAKAEKREPDFSNMLGTAGVRLVPKEELVEPLVFTDAHAEQKKLIEEDESNGPQPVWTP